MGEVGEPATADADIGPQVRALIEALQDLCPAGVQLPLLPAAESGPSLTVEDLRTRMLREVYVVPQRKTATVRVAKLCLRRIGEVLGGEHVRELERRHALAVLDRYRRTPSLANSTLSVLSHSCNWAERWGWRPYGTNPCRHVRRFPIRRRVPPIDAARARKVVRSLEEHERDGRSAALTTAALWGLRRREAQTLEVDAVDLAHGVIRLADSKTGPRVIPGSHAGVELLREQISKIPPGCKYVFPCPRDPTKPIGRGEDHWDEVRKAAGLPGLRVHDLRHAYATVAVEQGHTLEQVGLCLGHSAVSMTAQYTHLSLKTGHDVAETVARALTRTKENGQCT